MLSVFLSLTWLKLQFLPQALGWADYYVTNLNPSVHQIILLFFFPIWKKMVYWIKSKSIVSVYAISFCLSTVSAPSRTLGRRKLIRNRFTIDTGVVFDDGSSQDLSPVTPTEPLLSFSLQKPQQPQQPIQDTDRWVDNQFDLQHYENQDDVKETDILSDDDEYCQSVRAPSSEPSLEESFEALSVEGEEVKGLNGLSEDKSPKSQAPPKLTLLKKQCAVEGVASERDCEVIWVRREDFKNSCNSDIFWAEREYASCVQE